MDYLIPTNFTDIPGSSSEPGSGAESPDRVHKYWENFYLSVYMTLALSPSVVFKAKVYHVLRDTDCHTSLTTTNI